MSTSSSRTNSTISPETPAPLPSSPAHTTFVTKKGQGSRIAGRKWHPARSSLVEPFRGLRSQAPVAQDHTKKEGLPKGVIERPIPRLRRTRPFHPDRVPFPPTKPASGVLVSGRPSHVNSAFTNAGRPGKSAKNARSVKEQWDMIHSPPVKLHLDGLIRPTPGAPLTKPVSGVPIFGQPTQVNSSFANTAHPGNDIRNAKMMDNPLAKLGKNASAQAVGVHPQNNRPTKRAQESAASMIFTKQASAPKQTRANCSETKAVSEFYRCARCLSSFCCDCECQRAHWKIHREECTMPIQSPIPRVPNAVARLQVEKLEDAASSLQISGSGWFGVSRRVGYEAQRTTAIAFPQNPDATV